MDEQLAETIKQNLVSLIRKGMFALGAILIRQGWLTPDVVDGIMATEIAYYLAGFILVIGSLLGQYMKQRFTQKTIKKAAESPAGTPVGVIKTEVLANESLVTRL